MNYVSALFGNFYATDKDFPMAWSHVVRAIKGRWGDGEFRPVPTESCRYRYIKDVCFFSWSPKVRGNVNIVLPIPCLRASILYILSDGILTAKAILDLEDVVNIDISGNEVIISATYDGVPKA